MKNSASLVDSTEQSRVNWGKYFRTQHLQTERPGLSSPELEHVSNNKAPLPSPAVLMDYDRALPGTADRIVRLLEKQVAAEIARANKRETLTSITRLMAIVGGFVLLWYGKNPVGALTFIAFNLTFAQLLESSGLGKGRQGKTYQKKIERVMNAAALEMNPVGYASQPGDEEIKKDTWQ